MCRYDDAEKTRRCGGKTKGMKMELNEETVEEVNLPNISLPVTPPTKFDLVFPSAASTPVVNTFESASPITVTEDTKTCSSVDKFTISNPLSVAEHKDTTITNNNESNCVISPAIQFVSDKDSNLRSSGTEKGDNSEMCFDVEPATEMKTESVANILDKKVESTDKDDLNEASSSSVSLDKLKASPETWECGTQKICNKSDETKFAASEIPHSSAGSVSSSTPVQVSSDVEVKMSPDTLECTSCHEQNLSSAAVCSKCTPGQSYSKPFQYSNDEAGRNAKASLGKMWVTLFGGTPPPSSFATTPIPTTTGGSSSTTTASVSSGSQVLTTATSSVVAKPTDTSSLQQGTSSFGIKQTSKLPPNKDKRQSEVPKGSQSSDSRDTVTKTKSQKLNELEENSELIKPVGTLENKKSKEKSHNKKVSFAFEFTKKPSSTTKTVDTIKPAINFGAAIPGVANFSSVQPSTTTSSFSFTSSNTMAAVTTTVTTTVLAPITTVTTSMTGAPVSLATTTSASNWFSFGVPKSSNIFGGTSGIAFGQPTATTSSTPSFGTSLKTSTAFTLNFAQSKPCGGSNKGSVTTIATATVSAPITTVTTSMTGAPVSLATTTSASNWFSFGVPKSSNIFGGTSGIAFGQPTTTTSSTPSFGTSLKTSTAFTLNFAQSKPCGGSNKGPVPNIVTTAVSAPITTVMTSMTGAPVSLATTTSASNWFSFGVPKSSNIFGGTSGIAFGQPTTTTSSTPSFGTSLKTSTAFTLNFAQSKPCGGSNKRLVTNTVTTTVSAPITTVTTSMTGAPVSLATTTSASNWFSFGVPKSSETFGGSSGIPFGQPTTTISSTPSFETSLKTSTPFTLNFAQSNPFGGSNKASVTTIASEEMAHNFRSITSVATTAVTTTPAFSSISSLPSFSMDITGAARSTIPVYGTAGIYTSVLPATSNITIMTTGFGSTPNFGAGFSNPATGFNSGSASNSSVPSLGQTALTSGAANKGSASAVSNAGLKLHKSPLVRSQSDLTTKGMGMDVDDGTVEEVNLPNISLPATSLPRFDSVVPPTASTHSVISTSKFPRGTVRPNLVTRRVPPIKSPVNFGSEAELKKPVETWQCMYCHVQNLSSAAVCNTCGARQKNGTQETIWPPGKSTVQPSDFTNTQNTCTCREKNPFSWKKCPVCDTNRPRLDTGTESPIKQPVNFGSGAEFKKPAGTGQQNSTQIKEAIRPVQPSGFKPITNTPNTCTCRDGNPFSWKKCQVCETRPPKPPANVEFREKFKELAKGPPSFGTNLKTSNKGPVTTTASKEIHNIFGSITSATTTIPSTTAASRNTTSSSSFGMATTTPSFSFNMGASRSIIPTSGTSMSVATTNNTTMTTDNVNEQKIISDLATAFNICSVNNSRAPRRRPRASDFF
ncbi:uncharacterized protein [Periplaneta americana]|uniref:uncharacterized protein n=1 Tax=Periplaneta americana TaxID=6978 RepID=UPI0037E8D178